MGVNQAYTVTAFPFPKYVPGTPTWASRWAAPRGLRRADQSAIDGTLTAIDVNTGKIAWQYKSELPMYGGILATASNLVFTGEMNG